jgi:prepilin-type N-terminal cleavage/methylation domain-containing protein
MNCKRQKKGFSLIEVVIAMAVIVLVVFSATGILMSVIKSNNTNINTLVAYGLAQEGVEAVRNIRDSDWLLGASFSGTVGKLSSKPWGEMLPAAAQSKFYTLDYNYLGDLGADPIVNVTAAGLDDFAPWKLTLLDSADSANPAKSDSTRLFKKTYEFSGGETRYTHNLVGSEVTPFHRYVGISAVSDSASSANSALPIVKKYRVFCVVSWEEYGRDKEVRLDTEITNWKQSLF